MQFALDVETGPNLGRKIEIGQIARAQAVDIDAASALSDAANITRKSRNC
jgi:hypothetical protein